MTMRALVLDRYGPPEHVLRLEQVPRPQPRSGEVLVRVHAASLNSWDWDLLAGTSMGRVMGPFRPPFKILGADIAGTVEAVGGEVSGFKVGDRVFGDLSGGRWGGLADYVAAPAKALAHMPQGLSFTDAAALPQAGGLALQAVRKFPQLSSEHVVLINGAGGGVGTIAIDLVKPTSARIVAVDSASKGPALLQKGADSFIDYRSQDYTQALSAYDLIIDMVANRPVSHYRRCLKPGGKLVVIGGTFRALIPVALSSLMRGSKSIGVLVYNPSPADSLEVAARVSPHIDSVFPLEQGAAAFRRIGDARHVGKVVITTQP